MHFRLEPDVKKKFIQLLAIEQDMERENRIENDTFCLMIKQIRNGEREVLCAKRRMNVNTNPSTNYC